MQTFPDRTVRRNDLVRHLHLNQLRIFISVNRDVLTMTYRSAAPLQLTPKSMFPATLKTRDARATQV